MFKFKISKTMKDIQWSFISLATASISHLILRIILGRELGPSGLGIYTLTFTIYMLGMQFASFGIGDALTRYIAEINKDVAKTTEFVSCGLYGSIITGSVIGIFIYLSSENISTKIFNITDMIYLLKLTAFCFPFLAINKTVLGVLNGFRKMKSFAFLNIVLNATVLIVSLLLVLFLNQGVLGAVLGFIVPTIIISLVSIFFVRSYVILPKMSLFQKQALKNIMYFGFYAVIGNIVLYAYTHIDSLMIGYYLNESNVGIYSVATIFVQGITIIPSAIQKVTSPIIASNHAQGNYKFILKTLRKVTITIFMISLLICLILILIGKTLILILFDNVFLLAYQPLIILLIGYTFYATFISIGSFYANIGHVQLSYKIALFTALLNIVLNILLIPEYGIIGAAMATSISLFIVTIVHFTIICYFVTRVWKLPSIK